MNRYLRPPQCIGVLSGILLSCSSSPENTSRNFSDKVLGACEMGLAIPRVAPGSEYEHWHLMVSKIGHKRWNGQDVDDETLKRYMLELSEMPASAGRLTIHIEPMASCRTILELQDIVGASPLCHQHRCVQDRWDYERPIVN